MFFSTQMATQRHFHPLRAEVTKNTATSQLWPLNCTPMAGRWSVSAACCVTREPPPRVFTCAVFAVCGSGAFKLP